MREKKSPVYLLIIALVLLLLTFAGPASSQDIGSERQLSQEGDLYGARGSEKDNSQPARDPDDLTEGFNDITNLPGWVMDNNSDPAGTTDWFQGNDGVFPAQAGPTTAYIGANFNNTSGTGTISNWLITPILSINNGDHFYFWTRTAAGSIWPDRLQVRLSTNGASTNVGTLATDVGDFTTLLLDINPTLSQGGYPEVWTQYSVNLSGIGQVPRSGRLAFRYFVTNGGPSGVNSNYIGIDSFSYTDVFLGSLNTYQSRTDFNAANPGLPVETFEEGNVAAGGVTTCLAPLNNSTNNPCFSPGDILPGVSLTNGPVQDDMVVLGMNYPGVGNASKVVGPNTFSDSLDILFPDGDVYAVGGDWLGFPAAVPIGIVVYATDGSTILGTSLVTPAADNDGSFWGVKSSAPIGKIVLNSAIGELVDNLVFGGAPGAVFIPTLHNNSCSGYNSTSENEPNDSPAQANGPLCYDWVVTGSPNNDLPGVENDYYSYRQPAGRTVVIDVRNFLSSAQVQLFHESNLATPVKFLADQPGGNYLMAYSGAPGLYYVRLVAGENHPTGGNYTIEIR